MEIETNVRNDNSHMDVGFCLVAGVLCVVIYLTNSFSIYVCTEKVLFIFSPDNKLSILFMRLRKKSCKICVCVLFFVFVMAISTCRPFGALLHLQLKASKKIK